MAGAPRRPHETLNARAATLRSKPTHAKVKEVSGLEYVKLVTITPDVAARWLEQNTHNRTVSDPIVMRYARDMQEGRWVSKNGETIKRAADGTIVDGQHRLYAVLMAGVAVQMLVVENVELSAQSTVDTGRARSFSDVCAINGTSYSHSVAGASRWWRWYIHDRLRLATPGMYSHGELLDTLNTEAPWLAESVVRMHAFPKAIRLARPTLLAFVFSAAERVNMSAAHEWLAALDSGENLTKHNPAFTLRERLVLLAGQKTRTQNIVVVTYAVRSWNAFRAGKRYSHYRITDGEKFPTFDGLKL